MNRSILLASTLLLSVQAQAQTCIDREISLVADVSSSMDESEKRTQRQGYAAAFRDGDVIHAIMNGYCGAIAVNFIEFGTDPHLVVDWHIIVTDEDAEAFAVSIERAPATYDRINTTGIARAIDFAAQSILTNDITADKLVIDVSSDGPDNVTGNVAHIRDKYTKPTAENGWTEIVINGLPILGSVHYGMTSAEFQDYFANDVIGGPGAFSEPAKTVDDIARAFRRKLIQEIG